MIQLFKEGTSHVVNGITCESVIVNEFGFEPLLEKGYVLDPKELYKDRKEAQQVKKPAEKEVAEIATSKVTTAKPKASSVNLRASGSSKTTAKSGNSATNK